MMNIETIANSGQCFRLNQIDATHYELVAFGEVLNIYSPKPDHWSWVSYNDWSKYFRLNEDFNIKNPDPFLAKAIKYSPGLIVLRQDPWEVLISFIISQRKSIPAIKNSIERLCRTYGTRIDEIHYAFPTAEQLMWLDKDECGLGYRKNYIRKLARDIVDGLFSMEELIAVDYDTAKKMLLSIKGVGEKIANCVLLYGLHFDNAFPIDVHMKRVLEEHYPDGFPYEKYDGQLGLVQQYLFEYQRYLTKNGGKNHE